MLYQAAPDVAAGMRAKLQIRGVSFTKAMSVKPAELKRAAEDPELFEKLVRRLTPKAERSSDPTRGRDAGKGMPIQRLLDSIDG